MLKIDKKAKLFIAAVLFAAIMAGGYFAYQSLDNVWIDLNNRLNASIQQNREIAEQLQKLAEGYAELKENPTEATRREVIKEKSQDELLTDAVSRVAPTVVSVVITKDVPQFEVVYINPFGDDPFFKDFNIRVPQYRQKGTVEQEVGAGSGFIVNANGYIITNRHVVNDQAAHYTVLLADGSQKQAEVVYIDNEIDIAVLKIENGNYSAIVFGDSDTLKLGQSVFAVGNALGEYNNSVSVGIISGLNRNLQASDNGQIEELKAVIQTDAAINPGNSGGPLVNLNGEVIGVNVAYSQNAENIGFAIPINAIKAIINSYTR